MSRAPRRGRLAFENLEDRRVLSAADLLEAPEAALTESVTTSTAAPTAATADGQQEAPAEMLSAPRGRAVLSEDGTTFVADNGGLLRGPFASTEWGDPPPQSNISDIKDLGFNSVHLYGEVFDPDYVSGVPGSGTAPGYALNRIDEMVRMTREEGLYLVLTIGNGGNNGSFNYDYVVDFWDLYAERYADETHVLFEVQNEPHAWSTPYPQAALDMQADAYDVIRSHAPDTPVLLFSIAVLGDGGSAIADINTVSQATTIDWTKTGIAFHGYAGMDTIPAVEQIIDAGYPVVMTEVAGEDWGTRNHGLVLDQTSEYERLGISWLTFQHIPPNFISSSIFAPETYSDLIVNSGLSWEPDYGTFPEQRGVFGNGGQPRSLNTLTGAVRVQAEDFDTGANGVAYSDADDTNDGGQYRVDAGVDLAATGDAGGGFHVTATEDGEWLEYTLNVIQPGVYNARLRVAGDAGAVRVFFENDDRTGVWETPATGGSGDWVSIERQVYLEYGRQKMKVQIDQGGFNLNWVELQPISEGPIPNGTYKFLNRNSGLALETGVVTVNGDTADVIVQADYAGATDQQWNLVHRGAGQYSIVSAAATNVTWSNTYAPVFSQQGNDPVGLTGWGYDGASARRFIVTPSEDGFYSVVVADQGFAVEAVGGSLQEGAFGQFVVLEDDAEQQWAIVPPSTPSFPSGLQARWSTEASVYGDYNGDGLVNSGDYVAWRNAEGADVDPGSGADGDGDGRVADADLAFWRSQYGATTAQQRVELSWNEADGATAYNVRRATSPDGPFETIATGVEGTRYSDPVGAPGEYYYSVTGVGGGGESLASNKATPPMPHAHLSFNESGGAAIDSTGNGWDGTLANGATRSPGLFGDAVQLDGVNDHVRLPSGVFQGLTQATIAGWLYLDSTSNWDRVFDFGTNTSNYMFLSPQAGDSGDIRFAITSGSGEQRINGGAPLPTGEWVHFAVTLDGGSGVLYLNGEEIGRNDSMSLSPADLGFTTQNYLGRSVWSNDPYLDGRIDDFRVFADALSGVQVRDLSQAGLARVGVVATTDGDEVGPTDAVFTVTQSAAQDVDTIVAYTVGGSATAGADYQAPTGLVTIPAGDTSATITIPVLDDSEDEGSETLIVTLTGVTAGAPSVVLNAEAASASALVLDDEAPQGGGLHAYLPMNTVRGGTPDVTGNGWSGSFNGGATLGPGVDGNAALLDGEDDWIGLPTGVVDGLTEVTVAAWVNLDANGDWSRIFDFGTGMSNYMFLTSSFGGSGSPRFAITNAGIGGEQVIQSDTQMPVNAWAHVAVTLGGGVGVMYLNGAEVGRNNNLTLTPDDLGPTDQNYLGESQFNDPPLDGSIDEFRIYSRALTQPEIDALAAPAPALALASGDDPADDTPAAVFAFADPALAAPEVDRTSEEGDDLAFDTLDRATLLLLVEGRDEAEEEADDAIDFVLAEDGAAADEIEPTVDTAFAGLID